MDSDDPCRSPQDATAGQSVEPDAPGVPPARLLRRGFLYRCIQVISPVEAVVEYDGRGLGYETVLVNGVKAARGRAGSYLGFTPRIEFAIHSEDRDVPARVDVHTSFGLFLDGLRLTVDDVTVYSEPRGVIARLAASRRMDPFVRFLEAYVWSPIGYFPWLLLAVLAAHVSTWPPMIETGVGLLCSQVLCYGLLFYLATMPWVMMLLGLLWRLREQD